MENKKKKFSWLGSIARKLKSGIGWIMLYIGILAAVFTVFHMVTLFDGSAVSRADIESSLKTQYAQVAVDNRTEGYFSGSKMDVCGHEYSKGYVYSATNAKGILVTGMACVRLFTHRIDIVIPSP